MTKKKIFIYIATAVITFALIFSILYLYELHKANKMVKDFDKAFASKELKLVFYGRKTCHYCQLEKPVLKNIATDYGIDYLDIDGDMLNKKQKKHIIDKLDVEEATPVTAVVKNNEVVAVHVGYLDGKEYVDFLKSSGILPEDAVYKQEENLTFIGYEEFTMLEDGILVLGMNASQDCIDLRSSLNKIAKELKIEINYFNLSKTTKDEFYDVLNQLDYMNEKKYKLSDEDTSINLPLVIIIKDSKIVKVIDSFDEGKLNTELKKYK